MAFIFRPLPVDGLSAATLLEEPRLLAVAPEHPLAGRDAVGAADLEGLPWLQLPAPRGPWPDFRFPRPRRGTPGPTIRTADEWVTAIESGRGVAFTMPTVMANFTTARFRVLAVRDIPPAAVLLARRTADPDPLVAAFVERALGRAGSVA